MYFSVLVNVLILVSLPGCSLRPGTKRRRPRRWRWSRRWRGRSSRSRVKLRLRRLTSEAVGPAAVSASLAQTQTHWSYWDWQWLLVLNRLRWVKPLIRTASGAAASAVKNKKKTQNTSGGNAPLSPASTPAPVLHTELRPQRVCPIGFVSLQSLTAFVRFCLS